MLRTLNTVEKQVAADDGRWFTVRILPYRTLEDKIDGVVVTFVDITESKVLEAKLRITQAALEKQLSDQARELTQAKDRLQEEIQRGKKEAAATKDSKST